MKTGEVRRVRLPSLPGHTRGGERPAVLVQNEPFLSALPTVLIVPFTGKLAAGRFPGTVVVQPNGRNGLTIPSVALMFQLSVQDKRDVLDKLGELDTQTLNQIKAMIAQLTL